VKPAMPMQRHLYPLDWDRISREIRDRAEGRCECVSECGLHEHHGRCRERHGADAVWARGKVVLTVAHLDHDPGNSDPDNLRAMCQRCHLRYDVEHHKASAARTRDRKRGQSRLPGLE